MLYRDIRDTNFSILGPLLHKKAQEINEYYAQRHTAQNIAQLRDFMKNLGNQQQMHNSLRVHANLTEHLLKKTKHKDFMRQLEAEQSILTSLTSRPLDWVGHKYGLHRGMYIEAGEPSEGPAVVLSLLGDE